MLALILAMVTGVQPQPKEIPLEEVVAWLEEFRTEHQRAPRLHEFIEKTTLPSGAVGLARESRIPALRALQQTQRSMITAADLIELHKSTRDSISELHMTVDISQYQFPEGERTLVTSAEHEFAMSGRRTLLKQLPADGSKWNVLAYDEDVQRSYLVEKKGSLGSIQPYGGRSPFFRPESNVLFGAMLLDSVDSAQMALPFHDLCLLLGQDDIVITEELQDRDGVPCMVIGNPGLEVWVDPARNFSVLYFVHYVYPPDGPRKFSYECLLEDLQDAGNGIWIPTRMTRRMYEKSAPAGTLSREDVAVVTRLSVNEPLPDELFTDIIPEGTVVLDKLQDLTYRSGVAGSIGQVLDGEFALPNVGRQSIRAVLFWNGLVLCVVLGGYGLYRRHIKTQARGPA